MDLLVEPVGTGPSGLSDSERQRFASSIPNGVAAALGLRYLSELRAIYPSVSNDVDAAATLLQSELEGTLLIGQLRLTCSWPFLSTEHWRENDMALAGVMAVLAMWDPSTQRGNTEDCLKHEIRCVLEQCEKKASLVTRTTVEEMKHLVFLCDFPSGNHAERCTIHGDTSSCLRSTGKP